MFLKYHNWCIILLSVMSYRLKYTRGFTLIESVLVLSLISFGLLGILTLFQKNISRSGDREFLLEATTLAQDKMETLIAAKKYNLYASITSTNYPAAPEDLTSVGFPGFSRTTTIQEVSKTDFTITQAGSGYKKITVTVSWTGGLVTLTTLFTLWGES